MNVAASKSNVTGLSLENVKKRRGHPGLNRGPLDLQSNALPLSYTPTTSIDFITAHQHGRSFFCAVELSLHMATGLLFYLCDFSLCEMSNKSLIIESCRIFDFHYVFGLFLLVIS